MNKLTCKIDKPVTASKNNRIYATIALLGFLATPQVYDFLNGWLKQFDLPGLSASFITVAIQVMAVLGFIVRTWYTTTCPQPGPDSPPDVWLDENGKPVERVRGIPEANAGPYRDVVRGVRE